MAPSVFESGCTGDQIGTSTSRSRKRGSREKSSTPACSTTAPERDVARPVVEREQLEPRVRPLPRRVVAVRQQQTQQQVGRQNAHGDEGDGSGQIDRGHDGSTPFASAVRDPARRISASLSKIEG